MASLLVALRECGAASPNRRALTWCDEAGRGDTAWTYAELWRVASGVAARLAAAGVGRGGRVLLLAPQGLDYIAGFYGALLAGVIPVTLPAPRSRRSVERVRLVAEACAPVAMLVTQAQQAGLQKAIAQVPALAGLTQVVLDESSPALQRGHTAGLPTTDRHVATPLRAKAEDYFEDTAFLQYTSGSTSQPKGVMVTHGNLAHQCAMLGAASRMNAETVMISWLPMNHDMGLLAVLAPLFHGGRTVLLPSNAVVQRPLLWLETAAREQATMLVGPDFGYLACAAAAERNGALTDLDLSTLTTVWTGAEPVRAETLERFTTAFAPAGFRAEMWLPCYGMAETTLMATGHRVGTAPVVKTFCANALAEGVATPVGTWSSRRLTSCGRPHDGMEIAIVNAGSHEPLSENHVGEIWVRGASVAAGYFGQEVLTQEVFRAHTADGSGPWLRTGDLGFLHDGQLYPCGRLKDMIKLRGRNLYPQDLEAAVAAALPWLAPNGCAAFVVDKDGAEAIGILIEADRALARKLRTDPRAAQETLGLIRQAVTEESEAAPALIAFTGPADFPRTTSGKVQRHAARLIATAPGDERVIFTTGVVRPHAADVPAGHRKVAGGGATAASENHRITNETECAPDGATETATMPPPLQGGDVFSTGSGGSAALHHRLISSRPSGTDAPPDVPPLPHIMPPNVESILAALRTFAERRLNSRLADERRTFPPHVILDLAELGLFGMRVAPEHGGLGLGVRDMLRITQQLAATDITLAIMVGIHNGLGLVPIEHAGSAVVKRTVLPVLASGRGLAAFALTEIGGGSNPRAINATARRVAGGWIVNGNKLWIGLAGWARTITVIAQAFDESNRPLGPIACLLHRDNPALHVGDEYLTLGMRAIPQNHVALVDAFVPEEDVLGNVGEGWKVAHLGMMPTRLGVAAVACGAMKRCTQLVRHYAAQREVAGGRLLDATTTRERLDWMVNAITTADAFFDQCSAQLDAGRELHEAFYLAAKTTVPEWLGTAADWTLQTLGGAGYTETNEVARLVRDARILRIFEGPSEALWNHLGALARRSTDEIRACLAMLAEGGAGIPARDQKPGGEAAMTNNEADRNLRPTLPQQLDTILAAAPHAEGVALGRFTAELLLLAAVAGRHGAEHPAARWQQKRCDDLAAALRAQQPATPIADDLDSQIAAFAGDIGSGFTRRAPDEDRAPHPFFRAGETNTTPAAALRCNVPEGQEKLAGGGARNERNHRITNETECAPEGARETSVLLPPLQGGDDIALGSGGSAALHHRLISERPSGTGAPGGANIDGGADDLLSLIHATLLAVLRDQVDGTLTALDPDASLTRYGMDSLATVEAALRLERATGLKLPPDLLVPTLTLREVVALIAGEASPSGPLTPRADTGASSGNGDAPPNAKSTPFPQRIAQAMERVNQLRAADRYPYHRIMSGFDGGSVISDGQRMLMLGSYEYLNILDHPLRVSAAKKALDDFGTGGKGVPILAGKTEIHVELEKRIAQLMHAEDAIVYTGGYITNLATVCTFTGPGDVVIGDALNHASIVDGCRYSGARFITFAHSDLAALERLLAQNAGTHTLVVMEGVFSMDGDIGLVPDIARLCKQHGAYLMVDEAHSFGVIGAKGLGVQEHFTLPPDAIDLKMGTLSKALGGVGGFVAGKAEIIDFMRHQSRGYLFSGALPPSNAAASLAALDVLEQEPWRVERLQANARRWRDGLKALGYDTFASETPIVPVRMPDETAAFEFAHRCKERGVFVVPVVFPAVPQNASRLRTCVTASLTNADLDMALEVFAKTGRELGVI